MLQGQHDLERFAAVGRVRFKLKKSEFRLTAYMMLRHPHAREIRHDVPVFGSLSALEPTGRVILADQNYFPLRQHQRSGWSQLASKAADQRWPVRSKEKLATFWHEFHDTMSEF